MRRGDRVGDRPGAREWRATAIIGGALLLGGNGLVTWAEQTVPSGLAALLVATVPLWLVVFARVAEGTRIGPVTVVGLVVGFGGVALLVNPFAAGAVDLVGALVVLCASVSWAAGSLYSRRAPLPARPLVGTGMEMLWGGVLLLVVAVVSGELGRVRIEHVSLSSALALGYLIVFGSLISFTAYVWLLRNARTSVVATYAYVNPLVAVLLGWAILAEPITPRTLLAGAAIVLAVALIVSVRPRTP